MARQNNRAPRQSRKRFRPELRFESLEDRRLLSCTFAEEAGTLFITGDQTENSISLVDDGKNIEVTCDDHLPFTSATARTVTVRSGAGDDSVDSVISGRLISLTVELGDGFDYFDVVWEIPAERGENGPAVVEALQLVIAAGSEEDEVVLTHVAGTYFDVSASIDLGPGADTFDAALYAPPAEQGSGPAGIRSLDFDIVAGIDDDLVQLDHSAGNLFDVTFVTDLGIGLDVFYAVLQPPFADQLPGQPGTRALGIEIVAGLHDDEVQMDHMAGSFLDVFLSADLGDGADYFDVVISPEPPSRMTGPEAAGTVNMSVLAGRGNDEVWFDQLASVQVDRLDFSAHLGAGADMVVVVIEGEVPIDHDIMIELFGDQSKDRLGLVFRGSLHGRLQSRVDGGAGADLMGVRFEELGSDSTGSLSLETLGGTQNDRLILNVANANLLTELVTLLDGGIGTDICRSTNNVQAINCER